MNLAKGAIVHGPERYTAEFSYIEYLDIALYEKQHSCVIHVFCTLQMLNF